MIELTPQTPQGLKRYTAQAMNVTGSLLSPEETAAAFTQQNGPGCRTSTPVLMVLLFGFALLLVATVAGFFRGDGLLIIGGQCGIFLGVPVFIGYGWWQATQRNKAWQAETLATMDFPRVAASAVAPPLGAELEVRFEQAVKRPVTVDTVQVQVVMVESARYTRGTDTYTDTRHIVKDEGWRSGLTAAAGETLAAAFKLSVPDGPHSHPSWDGGNNRIKWQVQLQVTYAAGTKPQQLKMDYILDVKPG